VAPFEVSGWQTLLRPDIVYVDGVLLACWWMLHTSMASMAWYWYASAGF
jgi:hypothetical protein